MHRGRLPLPAPVRVRCAVQEQPQAVVHVPGQSRAKLEIDVDETGNTRGVFERWRRRKLNRQRAGEGDPRCGLQDEGYRRADPRDVVEADGVAMSGPGGAPQEDTSPDKRREHDR